MRSIGSSFYVQKKTISLSAPRTRSCDEGPEASMMVVPRMSLDRHEGTTSLPHQHPATSW